MRYTILLVILWVTYGFLLGQGIQWEEGSWNDVMAKARLDNKMIFVDVYTDWCGPCLMMDKDIFPDSLVGEYFSENFLSIKINAEDNGAGTTVAQRYGVTAYPNLLFIDPEGKIISSFVGLHNKYELLDIGHQSKELYGQYDFLFRIKSNIHREYSLVELRKILTISRIHQFEGKEHLAMQYLDYIDDISEEDLRIVMGEITHMELAYLRRLAPLTTSLNYSEIYLRRNSQEWMNWKINTERAIYDHLNRYKKENNLTAFEQTLEILKDMNGIKIRQIDNLYLDFYKQNNLDQYRTFAAYLIDEYIIPTRPEDVKKADEEKYKLLHEEVMKDLQSAMNSSVSTVLNAEEQSSTPMIDSLAQIYTISKSIADQLYDISSDFYAFYDDDSSKRKAAFWAALAHTYYPYAIKYFDNHIYILETTGHKTEASEVRKKVKSLPWYEEMTRINSF